jgi:hypothetical protein
VLRLSRATGAGAYADGVRRGTPTALQVSDRWHLLRNYSEALLRVLERHRVAFARAAKTIATDSAKAAPPTPKRPTKVERRGQQRQAACAARFRAVASLARAGLGVRAIVRETGLARNTVRRWMRSGAAPTWRKGKRGRITDPFLPYLRQRLSGAWGTPPSCGARSRTRVTGAGEDGPGPRWPC